MRRLPDLVALSLGLADGVAVLLGVLLVATLVSTATAWLRRPGRGNGASLPGYLGAVALALGVAGSALECASILYREVEPLDYPQDWIRAGDGLLALGLGGLACLAGLLAAGVFRLIAARTAGTA